MKEITVVKYQCDFCKKKFNTKSDCKFHERSIHKCPNCKHVYYVYGCEQECELKSCHYKPKSTENN